MKDHWEKIYAEKEADAVSWFQPSADMSLKLIADAQIPKDAPVIDAGGGASRLVDGLLGHGYSNITVLDISARALGISQARLGSRADQVTWVEVDVTTAHLHEQYYALWHDRAVFHFLRRTEDRRQYAEVLRASLLPRGHIVIAAFAPDGPEKCSGLEIVRYSPETLLAELGGGFELIDAQYEDHKTPFDTMQKFVYCRFRLAANFC